MNETVIKKIIELNNAFYQKVGSAFDSTRQYYWYGWKRVEEVLRGEFNYPINVLDLACGNGRFGDFLIEKKISVSKYVGIDSSSFLLAKARENIVDSKYEFVQADLLENELSISENFDLICIFGFIHHLPSEKFRLEFLQKCIDALRPNGILVVTFWSKFNRRGSKQFEELSPLAKEIYPNLEVGDYFFGWDNIKNLERYCHLFEEDEIKKISKKLIGVNVVLQYRSDGKKNPDNIYLILKKL